MKKFWSKLCMLAIIFTMSMSIGITAYAYDEEELKPIAVEYIESWTNEDFQKYIDMGSLDEQSLKQFTDWQTLKNEIGIFVELADTSIESKDGTIILKQTVKYEKGTLVFSVFFDEAMAEDYPYNAVTNITIERQQAGEKASLVDAGANTLMGMGTVFIVLILISFLISLLQYVPKLLEGKKEEQEEVKQTLVEKVEEQDNEELVDDTELVAVITAAIMASMEEEEVSDGFVVRSIRRRR